MFTLVIYFKLEELINLYQFLEKISKILSKNFKEKYYGIDGKYSINYIKNNLLPNGEFLKIGINSDLDLGYIPIGIKKDTFYLKFMIYQSDFKKYKFKKDDDFENLLIKSQNEIFQETNFEVSMFFNEIRNSFDLDYDLKDFENLNKLDFFLTHLFLNKNGKLNFIKGVYDIWGIKRK